jgi:prepilin-type N-terminal cleavage/methylation domain-containing protein/prepilin-type processing-associated H-X9-DG protein
LIFHNWLPIGENKNDKFEMFLGNRVMKKNKGFTLVELLVVISIIAVLLAILMPSMRKAQEQARFIICKSNLKSYGLAGVMYLQANNDRFPFSTFCVYGSKINYATHPFACIWHDAGVAPDGPLWPYLKAKDAHHCPTFAVIARTRGTKHPGHNKTLNIPINPTFSYTMNARLSDGDGTKTDRRLNANPCQMFRLGEVKHPSRVLFFTEENIWIINKDLQPDDILNLSGTALNDMNFGTIRYGRGDCIATFHKATDTKLNTGVSNVLFVDGHVGNEKAYEQEDITRTYSDKSMKLTFGVDELIKGIHYP